ncbi:MAG: endonuclease/exonuclease/phosphatase family protein [Nannocystaceae bacterium]|nr:endonuclease/exonuclease/phosphatase family protein [Nannocystaceae bacterium]
MSRSAWGLAVLALSLGCQKQAAPLVAPVVAQSGELEEIPEPEVAPEPPKVPEDAIAVGTFNLEWAFDDLDERPKKARAHVARTAEDWAWKRDRIVEILVAEKLDVITLTELGGERELIDIATEIALKDGYEYDTVWLQSSDRVTGQQVGILSRFPVSNVRRYNVAIAKHVAVDVELPTGEELSIIAVHMRDGKAPAYGSKRRKAARALQQAVTKERNGRPFLITGTMNSVTHPYDDGYAKRTPGILSAKHNRKDDDDCADSATDAGVTNTAGEPADHIIACGVELRSATTSAEDKVVRHDEDPGDLPWAAVPIEAEPYRDVSDHYLVWAEIVMPKPPAADQAEA